jgi:sugar lactone lactonase YvrE
MILFNRWRLLTLVPCVFGSTHIAFADQSDPPQQAVQFIIGDYLKEEGGNWSPEQSPLRGPFGIDFDAHGSMYIIELASGRLHKRLPSGELTTLRDEHPKGLGGDGGQLSEALFNGPHNCVIDADGNLLIADSWNHCVRRFNTRSGTVDTIAGSGADGFSGDGKNARTATFNYVMCIELDSQKRTLHIADLKNRRIRNLDLASELVQTVAGNGKKGVPRNGSLAAESPLVDPRAVASDSLGNLYILERNGNALRVVRDNGKIYTVAGDGKRGYRDGAARQARFGSPKHICSAPGDNIYVADDLNGAVRRYDPVTEQVTTIVGKGYGDPRITLLHPHGVRWHANSLYVVDTGNNRILRVPIGKE